MSILNETNIIYLSHGGGPLPLMGEKSHQEMIDFLKGLSQKINRPEAIIVFSAHWEESQVKILGKGTPPLLYDYYGFPEETYGIQYPITGDPELIDEIQLTLETHGIVSNIEIKRGYDHGVFIPLKIMYPETKIPVIQISLIKGLNPLVHIELGNALRSLKDRNLLIIGSGFSFHNMREFTFSVEHEQDKENDRFQDWLIEKCTGSLSYNQIKNELLSWEKAPNARYCHPREEHLLPLHVCFGISSDPAKLIFDGYIAGKRSIALQWKYKKSITTAST